MKISKRQLRRIIKEVTREERLGQARRGEIPWSEVDSPGAARGQSSPLGVLQQAIDTAVGEVGDRSVRSYLESWVRGYHK